MKWDKVLLGFVNYILVPPGVVLIGLSAGLWWKLNESIHISFWIGIFLLLMLYALTYEAGYKKAFLQFGMRKYYYVVYMVPVVLATIGFIYSVFHFYIRAAG